MPEMIASFVKRLAIDLIAFDEHQAAAPLCIRRRRNTASPLPSALASRSLCCTNNACVLTANPKMAQAPLSHQDEAHP